MEIDISPLLMNWQFMLRAIEMTLLISAFSILLGTAIGVVAGALRTYGGSVLYVLIGLYVDLVRSIPVLAILVWTYFALPLVTGSSLSPVLGASSPSGSIWEPTSQKRSEGASLRYGLGKCALPWRSACLASKRSARLSSRKH